MSNRFTEKAEKALNNAIPIAQGLGHTYIGTEHILMALLEEKDCVAIKLLAYLNANVSAINDELVSLVRMAEKNNVKSKNAKENNTPLQQHGKNLTALAKDGGLDPVIGREKETERLIRILSRKNKNTPVL